MNNLTLHRYQRTNKRYTEDLGDGVKLPLMLIPSGQFWMGQTEAEAAELKRQVDESTYKNAYARELPRHQATVPSFFMGKYPITQVQWRVVAGCPRINIKLDPDPSNFKGDNRPVERVSWDDATEFCQRLSAQTSKAYRLPSEAEWEYACRAGTETPFHFGETLTAELANYQGTETFGDGAKGEYRQKTTEVGSFPANRWGLRDLHGNVWEWCEDDFHDSYEGAPIDGRAWIDAERKNVRVLRGGSWYDYPKNCRSTYRYGPYAENRDSDIGFRVCCTAPQKQATAP
ncbi:MAG: formylglycine-generating enzyme family protein [Cyanobacteria bacterium]|nr:formylglycine-generating enzyme family protein [Cyanobacteriota bacterium]